MDFVTPFAVKSRGFDSITTFVDKLTKRIQLVPSRGTDRAADVAECFSNHVFHHHGLPDSIVSDRDPKFTSKVWRHLMNCCGVELKISTSRPPQTDGSTDIMNRMLSNYQIYYCAFHRSDWTGSSLVPSSHTIRRRLIQSTRWLSNSTLTGYRGHRWTQYLDTLMTAYRPSRNSRVF